MFVQLQKSSIPSSINYSIKFHSCSNPISCHTTISIHRFISNGCRNFTWDIPAFSFRMYLYSDRCTLFFCPRLYSFQYETDQLRNQQQFLELNGFPLDSDVLTAHMSLFCHLPVMKIYLSTGKTFIISMSKQYAIAIYKLLILSPNGLVALTMPLFGGSLVSVKGLLVEIYPLSRDGSSAIVGIH